MNNYHNALTSQARVKITTLKEARQRVKRDNGYKEVLENALKNISKFDDIPRNVVQGSFIYGDQGGFIESIIMSKKSFIERALSQSTKK
jgi:hypothetical protein